MMSAEELAEVGERLVEAREVEARRLDPIHAAMRGATDDLYVPRSATTEYRELVRQARFNILPLVVTQLAQALYVDGYRLSGQAEDAAVWDAAWQPNRMDARQAGLYRAAITYGVSYALVMPGDPGPVITPLSPRRCTALYADPLVDEWPEYALVHRMGRRATLYDAEAAYPVLLPDSGGKLELTGAPGEHGLGLCPVVRYLDALDDLDAGPCGKIEPILPAQQQLNQLTFGLLMAQQYAAFRQRWVTGMAIPEDESGAPFEPWNAAVNRVWHAESPDARFGDFQETNLSGYLDARDKLLLYVSSVAQIPPHNLIVGSGISNISAEALAALEAGHRQDIAEHQTSFGESTEQLLRLSALAMGDETTWADTSAQVMWRDTTPRSIGQVTDALGKMVQMLGVPERWAWSRIPGVTQQDLTLMERLADERDVLGELESMLSQDAPASGEADAEAA